MESKRLAVIIGIDHYDQATFSDLSCCTNDAKVFSETLVECAGFKPEDIKLLVSSDKQVNYADILTSIKDMCDSAESEDLILFYFAGHGYGGTEDSFLITQDTKPEILEESSVSLDRISRYFKSSAAKFRMCIFDACHTGRFKERSGNTAVRDIDILKVSAEGWMTIAACKQDESAYELPGIRHGVFTHYLIKGIATGLEKGTPTTIDHLKDYVISNTIKYTQSIGKKQTPFSSEEKAGILDFSSPAISPSETVERLINYNLDLAVPSLNNQTTIDSELLKTIAIAKEYKSIKILSLSERNIEIDKFLIELDRKLEIYISENQSRFDDMALITILKQTRLDDLPGQAYLGKKFYKSRLMSIAEFDIDTSTKSVPKSELIPLPGYMPRMFGRAEKDYKLVEKTEEVEFGSGLVGTTNSRTLVINSTTRAMPSCKLVFAFLPTSLGCNLLCYFISTNPDSSAHESDSLRSVIEKQYNSLQQNGFPSMEAIDETLNSFNSFVNQSIKDRIELIDSFTS